MDYYLGQKYAFNVMAKSNGPLCNLDCKYCYYLEKKNLYKQEKRFKMTPEVLEEFIKQFIESQYIPVVTFVWQGGEPCLSGLDFYKKVVQLQQKYAGGKQIANSFQTNGLLLDHDWCRFFKENNFLVGISVDGPKEIHDYYRLKSNGRPSWEEVMRGLYLLQKHNVEFNTLTVVNNHNSYYPLEVYHFLKDIGSQFQQYLPIVERNAIDKGDYPLLLVSPDYSSNARLTDWSVESEKYGEFLIAIFDEWVKTDVGHYYIQMFDATLASWIGESPGICVYQETCGNAIVMEHNGDIYSCDHYVYPENILGNIMETSLVELVNLQKHISFGKKKVSSLPGYCINCEYRFACNGECPKHRFISTPDGESGLNYLCKGLKLFFEHVQPYMQFMANELKNKRPPANVMEWVSKQ